MMHQNLNVSHCKRFVNIILPKGRKQVKNLVDQADLNK